MGSNTRPVRQNRAECKRYASWSTRNALQRHGQCSGEMSGGGEGTSIHEYLLPLGSEATVNREAHSRTTPVGLLTNWIAWAASTREGGVGGARVLEVGTEQRDSFSGDIGGWGVDCDAVRIVHDQ